MAKPPYNRSECVIQRQDIYPVPRTEIDVKRYTCPKGTSWIVDDLYTVNNKSFSQAATLLFGTDEEAIKHLFSNGTHHQFNQVGLLCAILGVYFFFACLAASPRIASGLVVPML
ncbi:uncharacterized protein LOC143459589 [Clavelina lepadiformis]|uniref:uncharacterized protein LOC143459589 n=1 Tax=Clavelina lepadiformis TaxID=159417 RepID=UPI004042F3C3